MITLQSKEGTSDIHVEGTRSEIIADAITICMVMVQITAQHLKTTPGRALLFITQRAIEYFSKEGEPNDR